MCKAGKLISGQALLEAELSLKNWKTGKNIQAMTFGKVCK